MVGRTIARYLVLDKLGEGGMGVVYKAHDPQLGRSVAIKLLRADHAGDPSCRRRFLGEARAAAALSHPNIVGIHEIGVHAAADFLVMEYVEGQTLEVRIANGLDPAETCRVALEVAAAIEAAHAAGIVHRDLKPGNIMLAGAAVKVLDFGLAHRADECSTESTRTMEGTVLGTCAYMAPEQAEGRRVDARADLFSFGAVLYEMLCGQRAFHGDSNVAVLSAVLREEPDPLPRSVPATLVRIVGRCLRKNPADRYQTTADLRRDLEEAALGLGRHERIPSIAVLPFANLSADKDNEYFSDGLAEDIIDSLAQLPGLRVAARTSAFAFRGKEQDVREIGRVLNVDHILEGSVRRSGSRLRVTAQLVKATDGYHVWSQRFDRELTDLFEVQDDIARGILENLKVQLMPGQSAVPRRARGIEAHNLMMRARHCGYRLTKEGFEQAIEYARQALELEPDLAPAYAILAFTHFAQAFWGYTMPKEALRCCKAASREALRFDPDLAMAHSSLGIALGLGDFDWPAAGREFARALALDPNSSDVLFHYAAFHLTPRGLLEEALQALRPALEADPLSVLGNTILAVVLTNSRQYDAALEQCRRTLELDPAFFFAHMVSAMAHAHIGEPHVALASFDVVRRLSGPPEITKGLIAWSKALSGETEEAARMVEELKARARETYVPAMAIAAPLRALGNGVEALEWLGRGIDQSDFFVISTLKTSPALDRIRSLPEFRDLLRKVNLEP